VIAAHKRLSQLPRPLAHLIRTRAVANNVPEIRHDIKRRSGRQAGVESFEIGVDVAKNQYAHESPDKLPIID
jgi:hypothetical protein